MSEFPSIPRPQYIVEEVQTVEVVKISMAIGSGTKADPYRIVKEWWFDGRRLARDDPFEVAT